MSSSNTFVACLATCLRCLKSYCCLPVVLLMVLQLTTPALAVNYVFDIEYLGNDMTQLAVGSDEPDGTSLDPGDTFQWTLAAVDDRFWLVETGGGFFPLMAFDVNPAGIRTGDFDLILRNNGVEVFSLSDTAVQVQEVHLGTNTIDLSTGLAFDEMFLNYTFSSSVDIAPPGDPVSTTIDGRLPIFGAPENNGFSPGIVFIPEPASVLLLMFAVGLSVTRRVR